ncbi:hypothetical protein BJV78DRAFT_1230859 [Lactifluus subvellereus]|nr:hypothetical protein BJV78DRAFT_1230859 [Lactifluus subvellereus]
MASSSGARFVSGISQATARVLRHAPQDKVLCTPLHEASHISKSSSRSANFIYILSSFSPRRCIVPGQSTPISSIFKRFTNMPFHLLTNSTLGLNPTLQPQNNCILHPEQNFKGRPLRDSLASSRLLTRSVYAQMLSRIPFWDQDECVCA